MVVRGQGAGGGLELIDVVLFCVSHALPFSSYRSARVESSECPCLLAVNLFSINYKNIRGCSWATRPSRLFLVSSVMSTFKILSRIYLGVGVVCSYKAI